jgi:hypothetical protein
LFDLHINQPDNRVVIFVPSSVIESWRDDDAPEKWMMQCFTLTTRDKEISLGQTDNN